MSISRSFVRILVVAAVLSTMAAAPALADRALAIRLAKEGRCESALAELAPLRDTQEGDAEIERLTGECALRLQLFGLAAEALERARALDPSAEQIDLHLAMARFHLGDLDAAEAALSRASETDGEAPGFLLYSGLVALDRSSYEDAAGRFEAASRLSENAPEPMASFYLGRSLRAIDRKEDRARAEAAFERVIRTHPGTPWADEARRALESLREESRMPVWASIELGAEYDDNVLLRGRDVGLPSEISGQDDWRFFWFADAGAQLFDTGLTSGGAAIRYGGTALTDLTDFDTHAPGATLWIDRRLGEDGSSLRFQYDFDTAWIDEDPFVTSHLFSTSIYKPWGDLGYTLLTGRGAIDDYKYDRFDIQDGTGNPGDSCGGAPNDPPCGPPGLDEKAATNRSGNGGGVSLLHHLTLPIELAYLQNVWLEGEYGYSRYWADGREYDNQRHQISLVAGAVLPLALRLEAGGRFAYIAYGNPTVFPDPSTTADNTQYALRSRKRREREVGVWVVLERAVTDRIVVSGRFSRTRLHSNADVYDYDQNVYGLSVRVALGG